MTDTAPDEQPDPNVNDAAQNPKQLYKRAFQRLAHLVRRRAAQNSTIDLLKVESNLELRSAELNAISNLLVAKGVCTADELFQVCAESAINQGNKIFAELQTPRVVGADGAKLNGS